MGQIKKCEPAKLIVGFIFKDEDALRDAECVLAKKFGKTDFESPVLAFGYTDYYQKEFGTGLKRKFVSFKKLILPEKLSEIKAFTNKIENKLSVSGKRLVNIDPGYLNLSKLVLASTKDFSHRIYLESGIYAEITLIFKDKSFQPLDWTYPDYRTSEYIGIFNKIRETFAQRI